MLSGLRTPTLRNSERTPLTVKCRFALEAGPSAVGGVTTTSDHGVGMENQEVVRFLNSNIPPYLNRPTSPSGHIESDGWCRVGNGQNRAVWSPVTNEQCWPTWVHRLRIHWAPSRDDLLASTGICSQARQESFYVAVENAIAKSWTGMQGRFAFIHALHRRLSSW